MNEKENVNKNKNLDDIDLLSVLTGGSTNEIAGYFLESIISYLKPLVIPLLIILTSIMIICKTLVFYGVQNGIIIYLGNLIMAWWIYTIIVSPFAYKDFKKKKVTE